jgi:hypothetical protein
MTARHAYLYEAHAVMQERARLTGAEWQLLHAQEPLIDFTPVDAPGFTQGRQSRVSLLRYEFSDTSHLVVWKRMGAAKGLTPVEAQRMNTRLKPYRASLQSAGWRIPRLFHTRVADIENEAQIHSYEEYIAGGDAQTMLRDQRQPEFRKWFLVDELLRILFSYPTERLSRSKICGRVLTLLPHGLDLKPANLVLQAGTERLYFIDLFGIKETSRDSWLIYSEKLDTLPQRNLLAVTATREGALLRFWRLAEWQWRLGSVAVGDLRREFLDHVEAAEPPGPEFRFIVREIENGYPYLSQLYTERRV